MGRIEQIKERLIRSSKGPWKFTKNDDEDDCGCFLSADETMVMHFGDSTQYYPSNGDAPTASDTQLIEHIHDDIEYLLSRLQIAEEALKVAKNEALRINVDNADLSDKQAKENVILTCSKALEEIQKE